MDQIEIDALFEMASSVIAGLPSYKDPGCWYDIADTRTPSARSKWSAAADTILKIAHAAPENKKIFFRCWAGDIFISLGEFELALDTIPMPPLGSCNSLQTDIILSLKLAAGHRVNGTDIATLFGPKLTKFGKANIGHVAEFLDAKVSQLQQHECRELLYEWSLDAHVNEHGMPLFNGHPSYFLVKRPQQFYFSHSATALAQCTELMREAENSFREERDIPRVGEGWVAETALFYAIKAAFPGEKVVQHGRPPWLGRQHLDVYLPDRNIALEYQGEQHDRPIAFFGGKEAFLQNVERDRVKRAKCAKNGVRILYVRHGYLLPQLLTAITSKQDEQGKWQAAHE